MYSSYRARLDATPEQGADVPESFQRVQWTRLPAGETPSGFVERVRRLLSPDVLTASRPTASVAAAPVAALTEHARSWRYRLSGHHNAMIVLLAVVLDRRRGLFRDREVWASVTTAPAAAPRRAGVQPAAALIAPPFVNLSGDKEQEYFSDGLTEELSIPSPDIDGLRSRHVPPPLKVREHPDIAKIAHKLNVAHAEGSVRRSGNTVRISAQADQCGDGISLLVEDL